MKINTRTWTYLCLFAAVLVVAAFASSCKAEKEELAEPGEKLAMTPDMLTPILGKGEGSTSGLLDATYTDDNVLKVSYYLFVEDTSAFGAAVGADLAPKLKELYAKYENIDTAEFTVNVPTMADPAWKPFASFTVTRKIMKETDWTSLLNEDFLKVVENLKYFD